MDNITKKLQQTIQEPEYNFLTANKDLQSVILLTAGGSISYGTNVATSDVDLRGICIERPENILGLGNFEQFDDNATDTVIYGLKKFFHLALNCNPSIVEMLGTKTEHNIILHNTGILLRDNTDIFLSKRAIASFGGYATAQLRRLQNALARDSYPQNEKEKHILSSILSSMQTLEDRYNAVTKEQLKLYIDKSDKEDMDSEIFLDISLTHYPLRDFKNIYSDMHNIVKDYGKINHRNNKKDELHLNKHSMHLIRLLIMGAEILEGKGIHTYRKDREFLLSIRNGEWTYEQIFEVVNAFENRFKYASDNTSLPAKPNYKRAEELMMSIYQQFWRR